MSEYYAPRAIDNTLVSVTELLAEKGFTNPVAVIDIFEQAKLAPDPLALPLSTAMRMARERTEAGAETWIQVPHAPKPFLLRHAPDENPYHGEWVCGDVLTGGHIAWGWVTFEADVIESAACRLVTPEEGERLLKGEM